MIFCIQAIYSQKMNYDSLIKYGCELYKQGRYDEAIDVFTKPQETDEFEKNYRPKILPYFIDYNLKMGNIQGAENELEDLKKLTKNTQTLDYAMQLSASAKIKNQKGEFKTALELESKALDLKNTLNADNIPKIHSLANLAYSCSHLADYHAAEDFALQAENLVENNDWLHAEILDLLAENCLLKSDFDNAVSYALEAQSLWGEITSIEHAYSLINLTYCYLVCNEILNAETQYYKANQIITAFGNKYGEHNISFVKLYQCYAEICYYLGDFSEAINNIEKCMTLASELLGNTENYIYANLIQNAANYNLEAGNYNVAKDLYFQSLKLIEKLSGKDTPDYVKISIGIAEYYSQIGNTNKSIEICLKILNDTPANIWDNFMLYAEILTKLAKYQSLVGNYAEAVNNAQKTMEIISNKIGKRHIFYVNALDIMASNYYYIGDLNTAAQMQKQALEIRSQLKAGKYNLKYASKLSFLAKIQHHIGQTDSAIALENEALLIRKAIETDVAQLQQAKSLSNLAFYNSTTNPKKAYELENQALNIYQVKFPDGHPITAKSLSNIAYYCYLQKQYQNAVDFEEQSLKMRKQIGDKQPDNITSLQKLALYYSKVGNKDRSNAATRLACNSLSQIIVNNFPFLPLRQRTAFLEKHRNWFTRQLPTLALENNDGFLAEKAFDAQLLTKGMLLNTEIEIKKTIENSGDKELISNYEKLMLLLSTLNKQYSLSVQNRTANINELLEEINALSNSIVTQVLEIDSYKQKLNIKTSDIQLALNSTDIAIEFLNFNLNNQEIYAALLLKNDMLHPIIIKLFTKQELENLQANQYHTKPYLYNLVWKPLEPYIKNAKNIYFSPSGMLHNIAIEYLANENGIFIDNCHNMHRLSSTREIAIPQNNKQNKKAAIFGGLNYNFSYEQIDTLTATNQIISFTRGGQLGELPQSKAEVETVSKMLKDNGYSVAEGFGDKGTEDAFKNLSGQEIGIIHISTHGFFNSPNNTPSDEGILNKEYRSLCNSGLYMAGASAVLSNYSNAPINASDGILTALEIAGLSFKNLDLTVLAACQTGNGEISSDGVLGLQRGFKKSGAKTIIMSLHKVDDNATKTLITYFYENYLAGNDKHTAFSDAIKKMREQFTQPHLWAAFIMID